MYSTYQRLLNIRSERGGGFVLLVDPDSTPIDDLPAIADLTTDADVDVLFVGGSLIHATDLEAYVQRLKELVAIPVIGFPGSMSQIASSMDAVLYLSVISGRNPEYLIGQHVHAAPMIKRMGLETISTAYLLVESGSLTTAQYMNGSLPLPRQKPNVAAATALAGEMMGMKLIYADAGSGAERTIPDDMIAAMARACTVPIVIGGGISTPEEVARKITAGASFVVIGNAIEKRRDSRYVAELAAAAHGAVVRAL